MASEQEVPRYVDIHKICPRLYEMCMWVLGSAVFFS